MVLLRVGVEGFVAVILGGKMTDGRTGSTAAGVQTRFLPGKIRRVRRVPEFEQVQLILQVAGGSRFDDQVLGVAVAPRVEWSK